MNKNATQYQKHQCTFKLQSQWNLNYVTMKLICKPR